MSERFREQIDLTCPPEQIRNPPLWQLAQEFDVVTTIRGANISDTFGLVGLELERSAAYLDSTIHRLRDPGNTVEPIEKNVIA